MDRMWAGFPASLHLTANQGSFAKTDAATHLALPRLFPERIGELSRDLGREGRLIVDAVIVRQRVFRHPPGPEQDIPDREGAGEVGVTAHFHRGVMPPAELQVRTNATVLVD